MRKPITFKDFLYGVGYAVAAFLLGIILVSAACQAAQADDTLREYAEQVGEEHDLPPGMLVAVCEQESHWRNLAGTRGEIGVCQIMPSTVAMVCPDCVGNAARRVFMVGARGAEVARIQAEMARTGHYSGAIDGLFGPITYAAVRQYQQKRVLTMDGVVGPQTWRAMFGAHDPFPGQTIAEALWNPMTNIIWAARYLAWLRDNVSPTPAIMIAGYNGGPGNPVVRYAVSVERRMAVRQRAWAAVVADRGEMERDIRGAIAGQVNEFGFKVERFTFSDLSRCRSIRLLQEGVVK